MSETTEGGEAFEQDPLPDEININVSTSWALLHLLRYAIVPCGFTIYVAMQFGIEKTNLFDTSWSNFLTWSIFLVFFVFLYLYVVHITKVIKNKDAYLIFDSRGVHGPSRGISIDWDSVAGARIGGSVARTMLGWESITVFAMDSGDQKKTGDKSRVEEYKWRLDGTNFSKVDLSRFIRRSIKDEETVILL